MYVTDSLFYLQHLLGGGEDDEDKRMFSAKYRDMFITETYEPKKQEKHDDIINRMVNKSLLLAKE